MSLISYYFFKVWLLENLKSHMWPAFVAQIISMHNTPGNGKLLKGCDLGKIKLGDQ